MSKLADILVGQMGGGEQPETLRERLAELRQRYGSVTAASRAAGIDRRTWQRMESGRTHAPRSSTLDRLGRAFRESEVKDFSAASVNFKLNYDGRERKLNATSLKLAPGTAESMADAYATGDKEAVARAFIDGVGDDWYHDRIEDIYESEDEGGDGDYGADYTA